MRDLEAALYHADREALQLSLPEGLGVIRRSDDLEKYLSNLRRCGPRGRLCGRHTVQLASICCLLYMQCPVLNSGAA